MDANKIDTIINLGDTFDKRRSINFMSLDAAKEMWFDPLKERNVKMHMLVGNHDIYYKNTLRVNAPTELLGEYENIMFTQIQLQLCLMVYIFFYLGYVMKTTRNLYELLLKVLLISAWVIWNLMVLKHILDI